MPSKKPASHKLSIISGRACILKKISYQGLFPTFYPGRLETKQTKFPLD